LADSIEFEGFEIPSGIESRSARQVSRIEPGKRAAVDMVASIIAVAGQPNSLFCTRPQLGTRPADTSDMGWLLPASPSNFSDLSDGPFKDLRYRWVMSLMTRVLSARRVAAPPLQA
jgi:hypothetical protein